MRNSNLQRHHIAANMTSLNGDVFVMRNGRSTSQVSIYNYPEHLNPFYEDEQHKRLRFWQINKSNGNGSRRNSFSLGGLKDVWAFKSFRLKKKSSTLGINKTSESPPPLRRNLYNTENDNNLSLPDYRTRYSTPVGSENFQRNAAYRISLQNVASAKDNASNDLDFNRNNQYRSTIQVMGSTKSTNNNHNNNNSRLTPVPQPRRYVYGGSVTPQPHRNLDIGAGIGLSHGSSQISMASTNPFDTDDDYEENNEDISLAGDRQMLSTSTPIKKQMHRKKRRAPAPPVTGANNASSSAISLSESSHEASLQPEPLPELRIEECMDIANLTAAIESFVKTTSEDTADTTPATELKQQEATHKLTTSGTTLKQNGDAKQIPAAKSSNPHQSTDTSTMNIDENQAETPKAAETPLITETNGHKKSEGNQEEVGHVECIHVHMESGLTPSATPTERAESSQFTSFRGSQTSSSVPEVITTKTSFTLTTPPVTRRSLTKKARVAIPESETLKFPEAEELKITEKTTAAKANKSPTDSIKPEVPTKPHVAEIHKPARCFTSTPVAAARAGRNATKETRSAPLSPVPPARHSSAAKMRQALNKTPTQTQAVELPLVSSESAKSQQNVLHKNSATTVSTLEALTITESHEDLLEKDRAPTLTHSNGDVPPPTHRTQSPTPTELREEALESLYRPKPTTSYMEWKQSSLAPLEKNVPPEKRKSVKDIIESINRSQRLLNASAHKDASHNGSSLSLGVAGGGGQETPLMRRKFSGQSVIERNVEEMRHRELNGNNGTTNVEGRDENLPTTSTAATAIARNDAGARSLNTNGDGNDDEHTQDPNKLNNNEIFKKCIVKKEVQYDYREQSPTASNLDWNPVPKPKRNKNLVEQ